MTSILHEEEILRVKTNHNCKIICLGKKHDRECWGTLYLCSVIFLQTSVNELIGETSSNG
jgi:hypothetical protein